MTGFVVSLFDYTGNAVRDWAAAGWQCLCLDLQHPEGGRVEEIGAGRIEYRPADLSENGPGWSVVLDMIRARRAAGLSLDMLFAWPPCTDLAGSGARHFAAKRAKDPAFQWKAAQMAKCCEAVATLAGSAPFMIENPGGVLSTIWRAPDYAFDPCDFGGYLPEDDVHPRHPRYIAPRDAYTKRTNLWTGNGWTPPEVRRVEPEILERRTKTGRILRGSRQFMLLGGDSLRTKNIRNETPRGFARALFLAHAGRAEA